MLCPIDFYLPKLQTLCKQIESTLKNTTALLMLTALQLRHDETSQYALQHFSRPGHS